MPNDAHVSPIKGRVCFLNPVVENLRNFLDFLKLFLCLQFFDIFLFLIANRSKNSLEIRPVVNLKEIILILVTLIERSKHILKPSFNEKEIRFKRIYGFYFVVFVQNWFLSKREFKIGCAVVMHIWFRTCLVSFSL